jgi:site-specific DNA-methyltransferase (adenine-specific)/adenine-specific DNA-methyltransferase
MGRRWIAIDCGKLSTYTIQKRILTLKKEIGNKGEPLTAKAFTLCHAGLYDFSRLRELPWHDWRRFTLELFECQDRPHKVGGIDLDGYRKGGEVLVFNHLKTPGAKVTYATIDDIHEALGRKVGRRFHIIAPARAFDFQEDYVDRQSVRYFALRIPYSFINEIHHRGFTPLRQPESETDVNDPVETFGFDFIRTPEAKVSYRLSGDSVLAKISTFRSETVTISSPPLENLRSLSMVLVDTNYDGDLFDVDHVHYAETLREQGHSFRMPVADIGARVMVVLIDIYGNEFREVKSRGDLGLATLRAKATSRTRGRGR